MIAGLRIARIAPLAADRPIWITETGLATWDCTTCTYGREDLQVSMLLQAAAAPVDRVYWYSVLDLNPERDAIEGFHVDENEYHLGLVKFDGSPKPAYFVFEDLLHQTQDHALTGSQS